MTDSSAAGSAGSPRPLRFGLVGAGPWAHLAHGPGLIACPDATLVGVWARNPAQSAELAGRLGVASFATYDELLAAVDAVAFSVPPEVQVRLALPAARAGKHLLLDKPVALDLGLAQELASEVAASGVASVVFFTDRFTTETRAWLDEVAATGGWCGGWMRWLSALQEADNPFGGSPWRREHGALWDTGPHALSNLVTTLGPVVDLRARAGGGDLVHLVLTHEAGPSSTVTVSQFAPPAAAGYETALWGEAGITVMPQRPSGREAEFVATAAAELVAAARSGVPHPVDAAYGAEITRLLTLAARQLRSP